MLAVAANLTGSVVGLTGQAGADQIVLLNVRGPGTQNLADSSVILNDKRGKFFYRSKYDHSNNKNQKN